MTIEEKYAALGRRLTETDGLAVAFSAGVDSTLLLKAAHDALGERCLAVTVRSAFCPGRETAEAEEFCRREGIEHLVLDVPVLEVPGVADNPPDRCYLCKKALFTRIVDAARERGIHYVAEGSNMDDLGDYRPGLRAVEELGILSPLRDAGLAKAEIRQLSRELGLPTWDKSAFACLASRFVYGERITPEKLHMVELAEERLRDMGYRQFRVRVHGDLARIELLPEDLPTLFADGRAGELWAYLKELGFAYVSADLGGYRMGSMNRTVTDI